MSNSESNGNNSALSEDAKQIIGPVLGQTPSGVFILTVADGDGRETGMLASWVQQASFDPPMVSVAVNRKRYVNDWLQSTSSAVLNLIGEQQFEFLKHFGKGFEPDESAFEGLNTARSNANLPVLADAPGYLEGTIVSMTEAGDHFIYIVSITSAGTGEKFGDIKPMVHIRKNGFGY